MRTAAAVCDDTSTLAGATHSPRTEVVDPADTGWVGGRPGLGVRATVGLIRIYQLARTGRTSPCRFVPTCSHYAVEAVERHGLRHGLRLTVARLARCRPGGPFGSDPVPE